MHQQPLPAAEFDPTDYGPEWRLYEEIKAHHRDILMKRFCKEPSWTDFDLPAIGGNMNAAIDHCEAWIDARLALQYVHEFKIGLTSDPIRRWRHEPTEHDSLQGYRALRYHQMHVLISTQRAGVVGRLEQRLLLKYRWDDYEGKRQRPGHHLCGNRRRGGEGADYGPGPYYVYVVWQFNPGAIELQHGTR